MARRVYLNFISTNVSNLAAPLLVRRKHRLAGLWQGYKALLARRRFGGSHHCGHRLCRSRTTVDLVKTNIFKILLKNVLASASLLK